ncbi:LysR substrate-binding domain-containing protein [Sphaerotilus sp.]|uniref:LysR substrate-binding domain-containing protein n=1 Tax=Sphaerotilus sp. TaxID=2093942 RepID=UPI002ACD7B30|nr:LysR substrate-binding domain-containing protein [Sphaerotilus sp.]MDZ7856823.1 LysR substrate-binding domain-containing protein [Sphaerotilus sp.]
MDLRQMRYFLAVAEERHLGRAAERLHMAQPPLTRQIHALEAELGAPLFTRTPKGMELTEAGQTLLDEVPNLLALAQRARERTRAAGRGETGRLDVGLFGSGVLDVIPRLLARFHAERPDVKIVLHTMTKAEQLDALRERRISVGFNRLVPPEPDLVIETVLREQMRVALPEGHPLCAQAAVRLPDLQGEPMILYPNLPLPGLAQQVMQAFAQEGTPLQIEQEVEDVLTAIALVAGGFGACVTTASSESLRLPGVVYRPLDCAFLRDIELSCIHRRGDVSPVLGAFLAVVRGSGAR